MSLFITQNQNTGLTVNPELDVESHSISFDLRHLRSFKGKLMARTTARQDKQKHCFKTQMGSGYVPCAVPAFRMARPLGVEGYSVSDKVDPC